MNTKMREAKEEKEFNTMTEIQKNKPKIFLKKHSKSELEKEISQCSKCQYWKSKSGCYFWGDKPCSKHGKKLTQLEDEVKEITGKEHIGIIKDFKIDIVLKPSFNQVLEAVAKTPKIKKKPSNLKNKIGTCDNCKETGYVWDHENGDKYMVCQFHFMEGLHCELDSVVRDYFPMGQWTQKKQDFINEIRREMNGFLRFNMNRYYYYQKKENE